MARKNFKTPKGKHAHHIIPLHAGGSDTIDNIEFLTVEEHAEAHRLLFEKNGKWQDELAWKTLSGQVSIQDAIKLAQKKADKSWMSTEEGKKIMNEARAKGRQAGNYPDPWNKGKTKETDPRLAAISIRVKKDQQQGRISCIGDKVRGSIRTLEHRRNLSLSKLKTPKQTCQYCSKEASPAMIARWHNERCKKK